MKSNHPNANRDPAIAFKDSDEGKLCMKFLNKAKLNDTFYLDRNGNKHDWNKFEQNQNKKSDHKLYDSNVSFTANNELIPKISLITMPTTSKSNLRNGDPMPPKPMLKGVVEKGHIKQTFELLVDSGSLEDNFIKRSIVNKLNLKIFKFRSPIGVKTADGKIVKLFDFVKLNISYLEILNPSLFKNLIEKDIKNIRVKDLKVKAIILENSPFDFILGHVDSYKFEIAKIFPMLFYDTSIKKSRNENNSVEFSSSSSMNEQTNLAHRAQNEMHVMECEPNYGVAQTEDSVQDVQDEHFGASKTGRIEKSALLDIDPDDDDIQNYKTIDPWNDYFQDAQTKPQIVEESMHKRQKLSSDNTSSSQLTLDEILNKLKIDEICKDTKLNKQLKQLVATYQDVFAVNVGTVPAKNLPI